MLFQEVHYKKLVKYKKYYFIEGAFNKINLSSPGEYLGKNVHNQQVFMVAGCTKKFRRNPPPWVFYMIQSLFSTKMWIDAKQIKFYLKITTKEYRQKLIEKFKESALKIILKKIVNEDFEWY